MVELGIVTSFVFYRLMLQSNASANASTTGQTSANVVNHAHVTFGYVDPHIASHFNDDVCYFIGGLRDTENSNILPAAVLLQPLIISGQVMFVICFICKL